MFTKRADKFAELPTQANGKVIEHAHCETIREIYQTIHKSGVNQFTYSILGSWWDQLSVVLYHLEGLPEEAFIELMEVIHGLRGARNELRDARFLFDVEGIHAVHRLVMRNRAVLRGKDVLHKVVSTWPHR